MCIYIYSFIYIILCDYLSKLLRGRSEHRFQVNQNLSSAPKVFTPDWYAHTPGPTTILGSRRIVEEFGHCLKCVANGRSIKSLQSPEHSFSAPAPSAGLSWSTNFQPAPSTFTDRLHFFMFNFFIAARILHEVSCLLLIYFRQPESRKICPCWCIN